MSVCCSDSQVGRSRLQGGPEGIPFQIDVPSVCQGSEES